MATRSAAAASSTANAVALADFPDHLIKAVLATEDRRFYEHFGIDIPGTFRAVVTNARAGGVVQGGSSITQQLAKNLFLSNERTIERKVKEAFLALWLETRLSKNEILKLYLDRAYMGGGALRRRCAPRSSTSANRPSDVNLAEAAMLAGLFKAPTKFAPHINLPAARARANVVLDNLVDAGFMTEGQVFGARRNPATADRPPRRGRARLLSRLRVRRDEQARRYLPRSRSPTAPSWCAPRSTSACSMQAEEAIENQIRQFGRDYHAKQAGDRASPTSTARCARWWAASTTTPASSTARPTPTPAGLLVQALRLRHRADERLQADAGRGRRAGVHRQLVPAELRTVATPARSR